MLLEAFNCSKPSSFNSPRIVTGDETEESEKSRSDSLKSFLFDTRFKVLFDVLFTVKPGTEVVVIVDASKCSKPKTSI